MSDLASLIHEIEDVTKSGSEEQRLRALMRISDLFMAGAGSYSDEQIKLFDDVLEPLAKAIEVEARAKLARHLARRADAPSSLVRQLAFDDAIAVAAPVLTRSEALEECDLVENATTKSQDHLYAIARRRTISEAVTDVLIDRGERRVVHTVAKNPGARISDGSFGKLVERAGDDATLAQHIGMRRDIPRHHFLKVMRIVSASVRAKLQAANPDAAQAVSGVVEEIVDDINSAVRNTSPAHLKAKSRIRRLRKWKEVSEGEVHAFANSQNFEQTAVALATLGRFPIEVVERALVEDDPDMILLVARAARCSWTTVKAILNMTAADRKMSEMDLARVRENFNRLRANTAKRVLEFYDTRRKARSNEMYKYAS
jgi:uncharacterized protein (DUF2336 family)